MIESLEEGCYPEVRQGLVKSVNGMTVRAAQFRGFLSGVAIPRSAIFRLRFDRESGLSYRHRNEVMELPQDLILDTITPLTQAIRWADDVDDSLVEAKYVQG